MEAEREKKKEAEKKKKEEEKKKKKEAEEKSKQEKEEKGMREDAWIDGEGFIVVYTSLNHIQWQVVLFLVSQQQQTVAGHLLFI